jgi:SAM-dependent methyltransferase
MKQDFYAEYYEIENVHWWFQGRWHIFLGLVRDELDNEHMPIRTLDVGCGTGTMLGYLDSLGPSYGIDAATAAVQFCRRRGRHNIFQGKAESLPFADGSFDLVCALDILEHLDDDRAALVELGRVCRADGIVLLSVPAYRFLWGRQDLISQHVRRYTAGELESKIREADLVVSKITYFNTILFPVVALVRLIRHLLPKQSVGKLESDFTLTRPGRVNDLLSDIFRLEACVLKRISLPFGVSVLAVAKRCSDRPTKGASDHIDHS